MGKSLLLKAERSQLGHFRAVRACGSKQTSVGIVAGGRGWLEIDPRGRCCGLHAFRFTVKSVQIGSAKHFNAAQVVIMQFFD